MCNTDYDYPSVYSVKEHKARKIHKCDECYSKINIDEKYRSHFGVWNGKASTFKACHFCMIAQDWLKIECGTYMLGGLREEIEEHAFEYRKIFLYRWLIGIREQWKRKKEIK